MSVAIPELTSTVNKVWRLDVNTGSIAAPVWSQVWGMTNFVPGSSRATEDDTDYDTPDNWTKVATTSRSWVLTGTVRRRKDDDDTYAVQVGQNKLREADEDDLKLGVRWYERDIADGDAFTGTGIVDWTEAGGAANGLRNVNFTVTGVGPRVRIAHPDAA